MTVCPPPLLHIAAAWTLGSCEAYNQEEERKGGGLVGFFLMTQHDAESTHFLTARVILKAKETRRLKKNKKDTSEVVKENSALFQRT